MDDGKKSIPVLILVVRPVENTNTVSGSDSIRSRASSNAYRDGYDRIFSKRSDASN